MGQEDAHTNLVTYLFNHPEELNLERTIILSKSMEYALMDGGEPYVVPDLYFHTYDTDLFFEVKTSSHDSAKARGEAQIEKIFEWVSKYGTQNYIQVGLVMPHRKRVKRRNKLVSKLLIEYY